MGISKMYNNRSIPLYSFRAPTSNEPLTNQESLINLARSSQFYSTRLQGIDLGGRCMKHVRVRVYIHIGIRGFLSPSFNPSLSPQLTPEYDVCKRMRKSAPPSPPPPPLHGSFPPRTATFVSFIGVLRRIDNGGTAATSTLIVLERILETAAVFFHDFHVKFPPPSPPLLRAFSAPLPIFA